MPYRLFLVSVSIVLACLLPLSADVAGDPGPDGPLTPDPAFMQSAQQMADCLERHDLGQLMSHFDANHMLSQYYQFLSSNPDFQHSYAASESAHSLDEIYDIMLLNWGFMQNHFPGQRLESLYDIKEVFDIQVRVDKVIFSVETQAGFQVQLETMYSRLQFICYGAVG